METAEVRSNRAGPLDAGITIVAEVLNEVTGGLTGGGATFYYGMIALGRAKARADAGVVRKEIGRGFASVFAEAVKCLPSGLEADAKRAMSRAPSVTPKAVYQQGGLNNVERWHRRDKKKLEAFKKGVELGQALLAKCSVEERLALYEYIQRESSGDNFFDQVRNYADDATGASGARVKLSSDPIMKLRRIIQNVSPRQR